MKIIAIRNPAACLNKMVQDPIETYLPADVLILGSECFSVKVKIPQSGMPGWIRNNLQRIYNHARGALSIKREDEGVCQVLTAYSLNLYFASSIIRLHPGLIAQRYGIKA